MPTALTDPEAASSLPESYEVVNGTVVQVPPMGVFSSEIANSILRQLVVYGLASRRGLPRMDMMFRVPIPNDPTRNRKPDVAFITFDRWPEGRPLPYRGKPADVVPDVVAEVVSPTDTGDDIVAKAHDYLRAGVRLVWVIFPRVRQVYAYTAIADPPRVFTDADTLDGGDVLPDLAIPVAGLFPPVTGVPESQDDE